MSCNDISSCPIISLEYLSHINSSIESCFSVHVIVTIRSFSFIVSMLIFCLTVIPRTGRAPQRPLAPTPQPDSLASTRYASAGAPEPTELIQTSPPTPWLSKEPSAAYPANGRKIYLEASALLINFLPATPSITAYS